MTIVLELLLLGIAGIGFGSVIGDSLSNLINQSEIFNSRNSSDFRNNTDERRKRSAKSGFIRKRPKIDIERESLLLSMISNNVKRLTEESIELEDECVICLEQFGVYEVVKELNCSHVFHLECIENWEKQQKNCPYCRQDL